MSVSLFRAVPTLSAEDLKKVHAWRGSARLPSNVPYLVDNLWEYTRPMGMPCRRNAVYASCKPALALQCAASYERRHAYTAYALQISGPYAITQLEVKDARYHEDIRRVQQLVQLRQSAWATLTWEQRQRLGMLFSPGCTRADWDRLIAEDAMVAEFVDEMTAASTFWSTARAPSVDREGELFFELGTASTYRLLAPAYA